MDAFTLVDTFGVLSPHGAHYFTKKVKEKVKKPLEIHFHSDFGLGAANTIMAVLAGAEVVHYTVTGIAERAGNIPMEETALAKVAKALNVVGRLRKKHRRQGARTLRGEAYFSVRCNKPAPAKAGEG